MKWILTLAVLLVWTLAYSQSKIQEPEYINVPYHGAKFLKEDTAGYYFTSGNAAANTVFYKKDFSYYRAFNKSGVVIAEGGLAATCVDCIGKSGKWMFRYNDGQLKSVHYYWADQDCGVVDSFYANGKLALHSNFVPVSITGDNFEIQQGGLYQEFYQTGQIKVEGYYGIWADSVRDTILVTDTITYQQSMKIFGGALKANSKKVGTWYYYNESGKLLKTEEYGGF